MPIMGPRTHGLWLGSTVFDGARAFEGVTPDLDRHFARVNQSAVNFGLKPASSRQRDISRSVATGSRNKPPWTDAHRIVSYFNL